MNRERAKQFMRDFNKVFEKLRETTSVDEIEELNLLKEISKSFEKYVNVIPRNGNNMNINDAGDSEHCWLV